MIARNSKRETGVCVLTFHRIVAEPRTMFEVSWSGFTAILDLICERGARVSAALGADVLGSSDTVLTFDDATLDHSAVGVELGQRGLPGLFFVPTAKLGKPGRLKAKDLVELCSLGHRIGSHGHSHRPLRTVSGLDEELLGSKSRLEAIVGEAVTDFAPPGGIYSRHLLAALRRDGYTAARSLRYGLYRSESDRWRVPTVTVNELAVTRGWVQVALIRHAVAPAARGAWIAKAVTPARLRAGIGSILLAEMAHEGRVRRR